jgi:hypothetical protein
VLRSLDDLSIKLGQVRALQSLVSEVLVLEVASVINGSLQGILVGHNNSVNIIGNQGAVLLGLGVDVPTSSVSERERSRNRLKTATFGGKRV